MTQTCILALDVGGTTISAAAVGQDMAPAEKPLIVASKNDASQEKLLGTLKDSHRRDSKSCANA
jgi:hypothetical protein